VKRPRASAAAAGRYSTISSGIQFVGSQPAGEGPAAVEIRCQGTRRVTRKTTALRSYGQQILEDRLCHGFVDHGGECRAVGMLHSRRRHCDAPAAARVGRADQSIPSRILGVRCQASQVGEKVVDVGDGVAALVHPDATALGRMVSKESITSAANSVPSTSSSDQRPSAVVNDRAAPESFHTSLPRGKCHGWPGAGNAVLPLADFVARLREAGQNGLDLGRQIILGVLGWLDEGAVEGNAAG
jgi:hypothetical protein